MLNGYDSMRSIHGNSRPGSLRPTRKCYVTFGIMQMQPRPPSFSKIGTNG